MGQVQNAFDAADSSSSNLKLFLSVDMSSIPCSERHHTQLLQDYIRTFKNRASYQLIGGKPLFSAFSGQDCTFGSNNTNDGWYNAIKPGDASEQVYFVPSFFVDPTSFPSWTVMDGAFNVSAFPYTSKTH